MREANRFNARFALFVGGEEFEQGKVNLKNMESGEQQICPLNDINQIINLIKV
jgi:histidyl-tRNA synthetase